MPDNSGCRLLRNPWVAKWIIRYCARSALVAFERFAAKSSSSLRDACGTRDTIVSASFRVKGNRARFGTSPSQPESRADRRISSRDELAARRAAGVVFEVEVLFLARILLRRGSSSLNTGSAITAMVLGAGLCFATSRRKTARLEAEGKPTISFV